MNVARVKLRAAGGLHDVDPAKIRDRYKRTFRLLPGALEKADEGYVIDNSEKPTIIIEKKNGKYQRAADLPLPPELEISLTNLIDR